MLISRHSAASPLGLQPVTLNLCGCVTLDDTGKHDRWTPIGWNDMGKGERTLLYDFTKHTNTGIFIQTCGCGTIGNVISTSNFYPFLSMSMSKYEYFQFLQHVILLSLSHFCACVTEAMCEFI